MKQTKYVTSGGLAFTEKRDMRKLSKYARKGWLLDSFAPFGYKLRKAEPQNYAYEVDFQVSPDEDYFAIFAEAGWAHICSAGNGFHVFQAPAGTKPIYTDKATLVEKYEREKKMMGRAALPLLLVTLVLALVKAAGIYGVLPALAGNIGFWLAIVSLIVLIFPGMPYIAYHFKLIKYRKQ
ncbi:DUF2812 domain-containing protein [Paenibacillus radicis (ex Gao et al. 2016)]|uniref:DUF2812 domain-containing protein n=1 Tax=Paenibacillus radicis (ex Gao et al. 2016) TaxID=1737354 RepID=A0A917HER6_9BACL|nr:DUF2812 domain-containing protein [Paenibacillus radicis (ex Gao et al. 2016)]GGG75582.1 hypothetical protein GCM10010918_34860 [Paenibacillus radicis (ex Gao et al. 2016)]